MQLYACLASVPERTVIEGASGIKSLLSGLNGIHCPLVRRPGGSDGSISSGTILPVAGSNGNP
jgi:hypothetical protein